MQRFNPLAYIRKFQILIIVGALAAGIMSYSYFSGQQEYKVSAIIEYTNERAEEGISPDGKEIDTSEIYSASVMQEVFNRMGMDYGTYNLDELRSRIVVEPILTQEQKAVQDALNEKGEEAVVKPTKYGVSFTANSDDSDHPAEFARQLLDNLLDAFLSDYAEQHIGGGMINSNLAGVDSGNYDYLEMIEIMDEGVKNTLQALSDRVASRQGSQIYYYRSAQTGYSFLDLYREFELISQIDVPNIYAQILNNRVSRDKDLLVSKYRKRIETYQIEENVNRSHGDEITAIIHSYVEMMRESGNTNLTHEYILSDINENDWYTQQTGGSGESMGRTTTDETVKYDMLLKEYINNRTDLEYDQIDISYCNYVIDVFSNTNEETPVNAGSETERMLEDTISRLNGLYQILTRTLEEYNEYVGAANISLGSNVVLQAGMNLKLYSGIVMLACAVMISILVIVLGRVGEIIGQYLYIDPKFKISNRNACDRYMKRLSGKILPEGFSCIAVTVDHVQQKNERYGVEACDAMISKLIEILRTAFAKADDCFISVNGVGRFILFAKGTADQMESCMRYVESASKDYNEGKECRISYQYGIAESGRDSIYQIKELMMKAIEKSTGSGMTGQAAPVIVKEAVGVEPSNVTMSREAKAEKPVEGQSSGDALDDLLERLKKARFGQ